MDRILRDRFRAIGLGWLGLTLGVLALGLVLLGAPNNGPNSARMAAVEDAAPHAAPPFSLDGFDYMTPSGGTPGWRDSVARFRDAEDFYGWLTSDAANARDPGNGFDTRALFVDDYAVTFAAATARGLDLAGYPSPHDLRASVLADR